jgi:proton-translocating NAD(P)+ transhydrogenase subunit alpha
MKIGVPKEIVPGERRVALVPDAVAPLVKAGLEVRIEAKAGAGAFFSHAEYEKAGASIAPDAAQLYEEADIILKVQRPAENTQRGRHEVDLMREGAILVSFLQPATSGDVVRRLVARKITAFSMDAIPRISRAQMMDALSSQATVAGYKAALIAAETLPRFFPMLSTAAGTIFPAKVLVLGAGVAGLQAIATARRLGAVVWGYDVRPAVKEQVESLGAKFLELQLEEKDLEDRSGYARQLSAEAQARQQQWLADQTKDFDAVITTALVPGKPAPRLITKDTVERMRPGSVIVDLAAEAGGNCELTEPGKTVDVKGVIIHGPLNLPSTIPIQASQMYARNVSNLLMQLIKDGTLHLDLADEVQRSPLITHQGEVMNEAAKAASLQGSGDRGQGSEGPSDTDP